jgi:hypothetical protein
MEDDYKTVCDICGQKTWYETEQPCKRTIFSGCPKCGSHENIDKPTQCTGTLRIIDTSDLDTRLDYYYQSHKRVEIEYASGETARGTIGKSTGWKPVYLLIKTIRSIGGEAITKNSFKFVNPV